MDLPQRKSAPSTVEFMRDLFQAPKLEAFVRLNEDAFVEHSLSEHLSALCAQRGEVCEHVLRRASVDRVYGHQIFSGVRRPSRDKAIQLAFGFPLNVEEAQALLRAAGRSPLYARVKRDAVVLYCLNHSIGLMETQQMLAELALPLIGREGRYE